MKCMKTRLSLVLAMVLVILSCLGCWSALAEASEQSGIQLVIDNLILQENSEIVLPEGKLQAELYFEATNDLVAITYIWDEESSEENQQYLTENFPEQIDVEKEFIIGTEHTWRCVAFYKDGKMIDKTFRFIAVTQHKNMEQLDINITLNRIPMYQEREYFMSSGDVILVESESFLKDSPVKLAGYYCAEADDWERTTEMVNLFD